MRDRPVCFSFCASYCSVGVVWCGGGGMFWGVVLICLEYLFTSAKTDEFWENRDGEALSQLSLCPPLLSLLRLQAPAAQLLSLCEPSGRHALMDMPSNWQQCFLILVLKDGAVQLAAFKQKHD